MGRLGDGEAWRWGDLEMRRLGDEEIWRWGDLEMRGLGDFDPSIGLRQAKLRVKLLYLIVFFCFWQSQKRIENK